MDRLGLTVLFFSLMLPALSADQKPPVLRGQDVIGMVKAGISPEVIAAKVRNSRCECDTSPAALEQLKAAGVPDGVVLAMIESAAPTARPTSGLADIREAKTVYLVNRSNDPKAFGQLSEELQRWGRWKIVQNPDSADLLLVLAQSETYAGTISTGSASVTAVGTATRVGGTTTGTASAYGTGTVMSAPVYDQKLFLIAVDRASDRPLIAVSTERVHVFRKPASWLVSRMRKQVEAKAGSR